MDIKTPEEKFKNISYDDVSFNMLKDYLKEQSNKEEHHLCLFLGLYEPNKKKALKELGELLGRDVKVIDTSQIVSKVETDTFENLDDLFAGLDQTNHILYFKNGDKLCGAYTGYSHSRVKYATPQERYFLNKVKAFAGLVIVDIDEYTDADKTLRRASQSVVSFTLPASRWKRFLWHLKHYSFHGFELKTKRPEAYNETG